jgi:hypothetical protein
MVAFGWELDGKGNADGSRAWAIGKYYKSSIVQFGYGW